MADDTIDLSNNDDSEVEEIEIDLGKYQIITSSVNFT